MKSFLQGCAVGLVILAIIALIGCMPDTEQMQRESRAELRVIRIDGCQYLAWGTPGWSSYAITHKGNCDNPIHIDNKAIELEAPRNPRDGWPITR